ncbi:ligase-associated DNA damage response DEXH box helicase [Leadbetterella byssophila]|uniref:ligase-associated DNA damage response DEXH box helicase n=1 Tax=Leadbetterella byssophila TaxID=316068 RepID=UPI0039A3D71A
MNRIIQDWFQQKGRTPFTFQTETWKKYSEGYSGMVVAPTGFGKTFSVFLAVIQDYLEHPEQFGKGLQLIWISPLRSLAKDLARAMQEALDEIGLDWSVELRNGDTDVQIKSQQLKNTPEVLLMTPESVHLLLAQKKNSSLLKHLKAVVVDEWHELLGSKRGVAVELALVVLRKRIPDLRVWGITATIGNLDQALEVLLPKDAKRIKIIAEEKKKIDIQSVYPPEVEILPWAGHMGTTMVKEVVPVILNSQSTLLFTNTRRQAEVWYQLLLEAHPDFAGQIALHHGSIDAEIREWVEDNLSTGLLKAVVATSSLDLGVDFKPVDTVIQVGSSKGVARFLQRAGRSGHSPFETSKIYFVPTHSLEIIEVAALKEAVRLGVVEEREPLVLCYDVLVQFMVTLALGGGFEAEELKTLVKSTYGFRDMSDEDWDWALLFITKGGKTGENYPEFHKVIQDGSGKYVVEKRKIAMLHRLNMGTIVSEAMLRVKYLSGGYIGMIEEYFISKLKKGEKFILGGKVLELIMTKDMTAYVKASSGKGVAASWLGGRLPLSSNLAHFLRKKLSDAVSGQDLEEELVFLQPLIATQEEKTVMPRVGEFLVESIKTKEGYHLFFYPFEGRLIHEVMAPLLAYRISVKYPLSFTMAMNDYGFELYSDQFIPITREELAEILSPDHLMDDVIQSVNATEMAKRKFKEIAMISGLVLQNYPGKQQSNKSLQSSSGLMFKVLESYDPENLLLKQAYREVFNEQMQAERLNEAFKRISESKLIFKHSDRFTPLSFPIKVDSLRQVLSSEDLAARVKRMQERNL